MTENLQKVISVFISICILEIQIKMNNTSNVIINNLKNNWIYFQELLMKIIFQTFEPSGSNILELISKHMIMHKEIEKCK